MGKLYVDFVYNTIDAVEMVKANRLLKQCEKRTEEVIEIASILYKAGIFEGKRLRRQRRGN